MLNDPKLALCANRNILPKNNEISGSPEEWFSNDLLSAQKILGMNLDFFVNWSSTPNELTPVIWIKQVLSPNVRYQDFLVDPKAQLVARFGRVYLQSLSKFTNTCGLEASFVIIDDEQDWTSDTSEICLVKLIGTDDFTPQLITIGIFKGLIKQYSGGPVNIGKKGLIYGTTNLECMLSHTDSLYPGDMDLLLLDDNSVPLAILEFKKHNLSADVSAQTLSKYYPMPDGRKYDRLAIFREYILKSSGTNIPIIVVFYTTYATGEYFRVEVLTGAAGSLKPKKAGKVKSPTDKSRKEFLRVANLLPKIINLYTS
ncbi:hypothetical protein [Pedobacter kyonggii]|uniref:Uncharacterized protein n=1 Tax=Pedobacter kyonggii TaxID=1926871 RepID=A0A4Q9HDV9_9SPHI|nr:hypothetical protein [Pedobacter kyonggii]TBO42246.1 hypothetical protein EYS08_12030 [Pedobacter kyonggii]